MATGKPTVRGVGDSRNSEIRVSRISCFPEEQHAFDYPVGINFKKEGLQLVTRLSAALRRHLAGKDPYFVFKGSSGAFIAALFARHFKNAGFFQIKVYEKGTHYENGIPLPPVIPIHSHELVFVDDLIDTGKTLKDCISYLKECNVQKNIELVILMTDIDEYYLDDIKLLGRLGVKRVICGISQQLYIPF